MIMQKEELIKALVNAPQFTEVEVTLRDRNAANELKREVISVEHRHDSKTGKEVVSLICFKSLKEQRRYDRSALAEAKRIKERNRKAAAEAAAKEMQQEHPAPELTAAPEVKDMEVTPAPDTKPMELKPMELKPMKLAKPTHTMADFVPMVKEHLKRMEESGEQQADSTE
jgi:hypothetical protein